MAKRVYKRPERSHPSNPNSHNAHRAAHTPKSLCTCEVCGRPLDHSHIECARLLREDRLYFGEDVPPDDDPLELRLLPDEALRIASVRREYPGFRPYSEEEQLQRAVTIDRFHHHHNGIAEPA